MMSIIVLTRMSSGGLSCGLESWSFAPLGLVFFFTFTHGFRRGLHSYAASRLITRSFVSLRRRNCRSDAPTIILSELATLQYPHISFVYNCR